MRLSLFEALRIPANASETAVRTALRRLIRRMYTSTRDSSGDVEEGLRFCNAASSVLLADSERTHYEGEYANMLSGGTDIRRSHATQIENQAIDDLSNVSADTPSAANGTTSLRPGLVALLEIAGGAPRDLRAAWPLTLVMLLMGVCALVFTAHMSWNRALQYSVLLIALGATAAAVGVALHRSLKGSEPAESNPRLRDVPIVKWRRERSVFMGSRLRNEEAAWVYRLRVAETDRSRNVRSSKVPVWLRLAARAIDYGLWGACVYALTTMLGYVAHNDYFSYLNAWWLMPILVVLSWIPLEAALLHRFRFTPGKWLFGLRCRPGMTGLNAPDNLRESPRYSLQRAAGVAILGVGGGLPIINLIAPISGARAGSTEYETRWDGWGDSVVTRVPLSRQQSGLAAAVAALTIAAYAITWWPSFVQTGAIAREARQLAPQVSWGQMFKTNPKDWLPAELLSPSEWKTAEKLSAVSSTVVGAAAGAAAGVTAAVIGQGDPELIVKTITAGKSGAYAEQANKALSANNPGAALPLCTKWVSEEPNQSLAWKCYGLGLQTTGNHAEALQALRRAQKLDPTDRSLHNAVRLSFSSLNDRPPR